MQERDLGYKFNYRVIIIQMAFQTIKPVLFRQNSNKNDASGLCPGDYIIRSNEIDLVMEDFGRNTHRNVVIDKTK
jgi:hypothetical protein